MISVVSVTYNRAEQMKRGLTSILVQDELPDQIVLVDDGSVDKTSSVVNQLMKEFNKKGVSFKYIHLDFPAPRISCIPRNIGIKQADGDVIIFTEPEGLHVGNTIKQLREAMEKNPDNTILASQVWTMGQRIQEKLTDEEFLHPARIINHPYAMLVDGNMQNTNAPDSDFGITGEKNCNAGVLFAAKKKWLTDIRGFDESFEGHGFDDFDLFNRLALYGKGVLKDPDIAIIHQWHDKSFYKFNIYDAAKSNGEISEARIKAGEYRANIGRRWGLI